LSGHLLEGTFCCVSSPTLHDFEKISEPNLGFLACNKSTLKRKKAKESLSVSLLEDAGKFPHAESF
jgi:hypothetical protein